MDPRHARARDNDVAAAPPTQGTQIAIRMEDLSGFEVFQCHRMRRRIERKGVNVGVGVVTLLLDFDSEIPCPDAQDVTIAQALMLHFEIVETCSRPRAEVGREHVGTVVDDGGVDGRDVRVTKPNFAALPRSDERYHAATINPRFTALTPVGAEPNLRAGYPRNGHSRSLPLAIGQVLAPLLAIKTQYPAQPTRAPSDETSVRRPVSPFHRIPRVRTFLHKTWIHLTWWFRVLGDQGLQYCKRRSERKEWEVSSPPEIKQHVP